MCRPDQSWFVIVLINPRHARAGLGNAGVGCRPGGWVAVRAGVSGAGYLPVPLQVGQMIRLSPPQALQGLPFTLPLPTQTGQRIVLLPVQVLHDMEVSP